MELRQILSKNIKKHRKLLGITQEGLAEAANLSWQTINSIEGCRTWVSDKSITKIAQILRVEPYQLLLPFASDNDALSAAKYITAQEVLIALKNELQQSLDINFECALKAARGN